MYKIKQIPEDFIVKEVSKPLTKNQGLYAIFRLKKVNYTTIDALSVIAKRPNIPLKHFSFAGSKDKIAVTEQHCSAKNVKKEKLENIKLKNIEINFIGYSDSPISLGDLEGNEFIITVRDLEEQDINRLTENYKLLTKNKIPNLFGPQRFSKNNAEIGKSIIKKDYKKALELIDNPKTKDYLLNNPNNYIGALRTIPKKLLLMFVHAYQSKLWNETVIELLKAYKGDNIKIPIIGFGLEDHKLQTINHLLSTIMQRENISERDFIIREIPELSSEGGERDLFISIKDFKINNPEPDELNKDKKKVVLEFFLPKGCYATVVVDFLWE